MTSPDDDAIDALLRKQFAGPVPDGGFAARVMQRVPARKRRSAWPVGTGVLAGLLAGAWSLRESSLVQAGWRDWMGSDPSAQAFVLMLAVGGLSLLSALWGAMEAEDR